MIEPTISTEPLRKKLMQEIFGALGRRFKDGWNADRTIHDIIDTVSTKVTRSFEEERAKLAMKFAFPAVNKMIAQHFIWASDSLDAPFTEGNSFNAKLVGCRSCTSENFEIYPPESFQERMVEGILFALRDLNCDTHFVEAAEEADSAAHFLMHNWLNDNTGNRV